MKSRKRVRPIGGLTVRQSMDFADIIYEKVREREQSGYDCLCDSDIKDILDECDRRGIPVTRTELELMGLR